MAERERVVEVKDLTVGYDGQAILHDLNFSIYSGEIVALMGGSGCGKSTLLKHIIGLYEPMAGDILIYGSSMVNADWREKNELMRRFGVTYQYGALFGSMTVAENVELPLREYTSLTAGERREVVQQKLEQVGLDKFGEYLPAALSGGMRKRAGLARALALEPKLLFFDEPSAGLDPLTSADLDRLILKLSRECAATVVIVTHELDSVFAIADRALMLDKKIGQLVADGNPLELAEHSDNEYVRNFLSRGGLHRAEMR